MARISITHFSDPGCPWAYSASPALAVLRWRYGEQLDWRLVTIGLSEDPQRYVERGYTPTRMAVGNLGFRRYGMPFASEPRARIAATARACRAIVATRLLAPGREHDVLRALQFGWFTSTLVLDEDEDIATALSRVERAGRRAIVAAIDDAAHARRLRAGQEGDAHRRRRRPPTSRARRARPTARFATRRPRSCSSATAAAWRRAASRASRPTTC